MAARPMGPQVPMTDAGMNEALDIAMSMTLRRLRLQAINWRASAIAALVECDYDLAFVMGMSMDALALMLDTEAKGVKARVEAGGEDDEG